jgi:TIR domain
VKLLASLNIKHGQAIRKIELLHGDLSSIPPRHGVDILVVSAFPDDYIPTETSLIGALYNEGISVEQLARSKARDMRKEFSCWLSRPVISSDSFKRLLCIESGWRGTPPEITDDLFRALVPLFLEEYRGGSVAMPIIGAGDQGWPVDVMLSAVLRSALLWFRRGLFISVLKIVVFSADDVESAKRTFLKFQHEENTRERVSRHSKRKKRLEDTAENAYEVFISYCHTDSDPAQVVADSLARFIPRSRVFYDQKSIVAGGSWLTDIADSLDNSRRVVALFTPNYWSSPYCKDEFTAALTRQYDSGEQVLFPIYFQSAKIPYLFRNLQYVDCREADAAKLLKACKILCGTLSLSQK